MLDTHQLKVFLVAAETLNFSKAAAQLHLSQPSVTQHIQQLEAHFGMPLFFRSGRSTTLTEAGLALVPLAREMVAASVRTDEVMESLRGEPHGLLRIGCSTTPGKYLLPTLLADFLRRYPRIEASVSVSSRERALDLLCTNRVHLALTSVFQYSSDIEFHRFITEPVVLIAPLHHAWARSGEIDAAQLAQEPVIFREESAGSFSAVRDGLAQIGMDVYALRRVLTLGNSEAIAFAVEEGIGVGFVSHLVASRIVGGRVAVIKIRDLAIHQDIYIGQHARHPATSAQAAFWQFITDPHNSALQRLQAELSGQPAPV